MNTKVCKRCKIEKELNQFYNRNENRDGKSSKCNKCFYEIKKEYRLKHKEKHKEYTKNYNKQYFRQRLKKDPIFRMTCINRTLIYRALKGSKSKRSIEILGCSIEKLWQHLENQFTNGMTRDNYGKWHVDHIIPLASAQTIKDKEKLCHYTNLQPLWANDNLKKGSKIL